MLPGDAQGLGQGDYPQLLAIFANQANLTGMDIFINTELFADSLSPRKSVATNQVFYIAIIA